MRNDFVQKITELVLSNKKVCLLTGDMGNNLFEDIIRAAPKQFINCGISEAAMVGMAAGLSSKGHIPFIYSIAPFVTLRVLEQIKIDLCYNEFPATIIGLGAGLSYGALGPTHHSLEDIAVLRSIPNLDIYLPSCAKQLVAYMDDRLYSKKPAYIRLGRNEENNMYESSIINTKVGKATYFDGGRDVLVISAGAIVNEALKAKDALHKLNINCSVVDLGTIRPLDSELVKSLLLDSFDTWYILEEHGPNGIYSILLEELLLYQPFYKLPKLISKNTGDQFIHNLGNREFLLSSLGIDAQSLTEEIYLNITAIKDAI